MTHQLKHEILSCGDGDDLYNMCISKKTSETWVAILHVGVLSGGVDYDLTHLDYN